MFTENLPLTSRTFTTHLIVVCDGSWYNY